MAAIVTAVAADSVVIATAAASAAVRVRPRGEKYHEPTS